MTNEQYLNYVMLTERQYDWSMVVYEYIVENMIKNWKEGFDFVIRWSSGKYSKGDTYRSAYFLLESNLVKAEWVKRIIEEMNCSTGSPSLCAYLLLKNGYVDVDWVIQILEKENCNDSIVVAHYLNNKNYISDIEYQEIYDKIKNKKDI